MYKLLEAHAQIRRAEHTAKEEIVQALADCGGKLQDCAAQLKTPAEALLRHRRTLGLTK
jgi:two-component system nitrogen regulation response regulator GlnG